MGHGLPNAASSLPTGIFSKPILEGIQARLSAGYPPMQNPSSLPLGFSAGSSFFSQSMGEARIRTSLCLSLSSLRMQAIAPSLIPGLLKVVAMTWKRHLLQHKILNGTWGSKGSKCVLFLLCVWNLSALCSALEDRINL